MLALKTLHSKIIHWFELSNGNKSKRIDARWSTLAYPILYLWMLLLLQVPYSCLDETSKPAFYMTSSNHHLYNPLEVQESHSSLCIGGFWDKTTPLQVSQYSDNTNYQCLVTMNKFTQYHASLNRLKWIRASN